MRANEVFKIVRIGDNIAELWLVAREADGFRCKFWTLDETQLIAATDWEKYGGDKPDFFATPKGERVFDAIADVHHYFGDTGHKQFAEHATELLSELMQKGRFAA